MAKTPPRGRKLVIAAAAAVSFCLGAGVAANVAPTSKALRGSNIFLTAVDASYTTCSNSAHCTRCTIRARWLEGKRKGKVKEMVICHDSAQFDGHMCCWRYQKHFSPNDECNDPVRGNYWEDAAAVVKKSSGQCVGSQGWKSQGWQKEMIPAVSRVPLSGEEGAFPPHLISCASRSKNRFEITSR